MGYYVRYGFGADPKELDEVYLKTDGRKKSPKIHVTSNICFADFFEERVYVKAAYNSYLYYTVRCNKDMLEKLLKWLNSRHGGFSLELVQDVFTGYYINEQEKSYELGNSSRGYSIQNIENIEDDGKNFPVSCCVVKITIPEFKYEKAKFMLEYLIMVVIRMIDLNEDYLKNMSKSSTVIKNIVNSSNIADDGHCVYCGRQANPKKGTSPWQPYLIPLPLTVKDLGSALNIKALDNGLEKSADFKREGMYPRRQTSIIDLALGRS